MTRFRCLTPALVCLLLPSLVEAQAPAPPAAPAATSVGTGVDRFMITMYPRLRRFLIAAADMMPEEGYTLRPSPDARTFAEAVEHIGVSNLAQCLSARGTPMPANEVAAFRKTLTTKAALTRLISDSMVACDPIFAAPGDDRAAQTRATLSVHSWEMYGTLAVYLRLKGLVPPSTEEQRKAGGGDPELM